ncbi:MAG: PNGase F N-terminal domain-containing protein [Mucinivorans sp.]
MKKLLSITIVLMAVCSTAQGSSMPKVTGLRVTYKHGIQMDICGKQVAITHTSKRKTDKARQATYEDFENMRLYQMVIMPKGDTLTVSSKIELLKMESVGEDTILNYPTTHIRTSINSNTMDIWYTNVLGFNGTPLPKVGIPEGLVLKISRNGNIILMAEAIEHRGLEEKLLPPSWGKMVSAEEQRSAVIQSVVQTVDIFNQDRVGFVGGAAPVVIDREQELYTVAGGTVILKKVQLPKHVDGLNIFAELSQYSDGDAYDRTGSVFVIPTGKKQSFLDALSSKGLNSLPSFMSDTNKYPGIVSSETFDTPVELMRFFTPFGIRKFNHIKVQGQVWADSTLWKQDVSHLAPLLCGEAWIGAYIGNWDSKGHKVSLKLKYYPEGMASEKSTVIPLFNTVNLLEQAGQTYPTFFDKDSMRVTFRLKKEAKNVKLVYLSTGHGGWGGGDEFNQKLNTIYLDGVKVYSFIPWREDCATFRNLNPCSGNFSNGLSSSDLSRSNWCPGSVTNPVYIPLGDLSKGEHTISVQIPLGEPEGGSFSYWCISGELIY